MEALGRIKAVFEGSERTVSLADLIVLAGTAAVKRAAQRASFAVEEPFLPGRQDATQEQTEVDFYAVMEPEVDGFRNYQRPDSVIRAEEALLDRAQLLTLSAAEMTALVGGLRVLEATYGGKRYGVLTDRPGLLTNDDFVNLLDMGVVWRDEQGDGRFFVGQDRRSGQVRWYASRADLVFAANSQLRAYAEVYASDHNKFVRDFVAAWAKVMNLDRFDVHWR